MTGEWPIAPGIATIKEKKQNNLQKQHSILQMLNGLMATFLTAEVHGAHETNTIIMTHALLLVIVFTDESCSCISSAEGRTLRKI